MQVYDFKVILKPDEDTGGYVVSCPALPGCYTQGDTVDEALENIKEVILLCLEDLQSQDQPILTFWRGLFCFTVGVPAQRQGDRGSRKNRDGRG
jgi:predicted RNase H-like HicB family nuclease